MLSTSVNMSVSQAAGALDGYSKWQEIIAENLASASVPGFKRRDISFSSLQGAAAAGAISGTPAMPAAQAVTSFRPGDMRYTGVATDVAIESTGFFAVQLPNGTTAYTRDGEFKINAQEQLVTKQGYIVLGEAGDIRLDQNALGSLSISSAGVVSQGMEAQGRIKVVDFNQPQLLTPMSGGCFLSENPQLIEAEIAHPSLRQSFLETSNTSTATEMVNLISAMRAFEANQRVIQVHDERMGRAISELGSPT
jgi:flagellar basal-body rod protein FlgF